MLKAFYKNIGSKKSEFLMEILKSLDIELLCKIIRQLW